MNIIRSFIHLIIVTTLFCTTVACTSVQISDYTTTTPQLDLFTYFSGETKAYGQFAGRDGMVKRKFTVDITGTVAGDTLTLDERFVYDDGETQTRTWAIQRTGENTYVGTAGDVVGEAAGRSAGSALNWHYTLDLPYKDGSIHVQFDDWLHLHNPSIMINTADVTKFGFKVGEVTLFFIKS